MNVLRALRRVFSLFSRPICENATLFAVLYALGVVCEWATLPNYKGAHLYGNLFLELFFDLYIVAIVLVCIPQRVRKWVRRAIYIIMYTVSVVDVYCFWKFKSTLTPTMLLLVGETDTREAGEFVRSYLSTDVLTSPVGWILLLMLLHLLLAWRQKWIAAHADGFVEKAKPALGMAAAALFVWSACTSWHNKAGIYRLMSGHNIGEVEHTLTEKDHAVLYSPLWRLSFSVRANQLAAQQIDRLVATIDKVRVDSCSFRSPTIVLIIGESYGRHHSAQYGYPLPTTPRQQQREKTGMLVKYTDVVSPWNLTSFVFKNVFSLHVIGQPGEWCDYPLFPEVFRKAGYHVTFLTNQFLPQAKEALYDFSGGFFLNNPKLSAAQFDTRNSEVHRYDAGLLKDYDNFKQQGVFDGQQRGNLVIFHLLGQHVSYKMRSPRSRTKFFASDYEAFRPELTDKQRKMISYYDNAVAYNDSIVDQICRRFDRDEAIVVYMPDHGEECYEESRGFICRNHSATIDYSLAKYEFEIPFWIYCSHKYAVRHPEVYKQVVEASRRPFMTDALPHMLLYLAGISSPDYHEEYNLLSPAYDTSRPRLLKATTDYNELVKAEMENNNKKEK